MKIVTIGDQFVRHEIMGQEVLKHFPDAKVSGFDTGWPIDLSKSVYKGTDISEYDGTEEDVIEAAKDADYLVVDIAPVSKKVMEAIPNLKGIAVTRGGAVNINVEEATKKNIPVFNSPGRNLSAVAEFTVAAALAHLKNIPEANRRLKEGQWRSDYYSFENVGKEMSEIQVGVIGFGNIGQQVARMFHALGSKILVYDPFVPKKVIESKGYEYAEIDEICRKCNVITLHARVTEENVHMIGKKQIDAMTKETLLINTARAPLVDMDALYEALEAGRIGGAALDVFDDEPLKKDSRYYKLDNLTMTPHIGGASLATIKRAVNMAISDLAAYDQGKETKYCLNKEVIKK
ncbi:2-hydroxyacid dehydrogenase [Extibacter muris]|uniref:2-hydroxyacid dehydrogenase n=1 Tax=Extibacter muris TaxID=1796622 RepID=UPI001D088D42|nr:2-hydroxyacid dehydrogenase [Extibacter muris]MCB6203319.1 2-hydroxyacid dehydrogenase [Extibacter muris]MCQ4664679.1 2-hydroxyacid dehydrogenase [Extibacter muris]MCQ4693838.1 2-hydroxyacid dehydrogenase [Extibacter muris]